MSEIQVKCVTIANKQECGIDLAGLETTSQAAALFEVALRTGNNQILSEEDAVSQFLVKVVCDREPPEGKQQCIDKVEAVSKEEGVYTALNRLPRSARQSVQRQADRFLEDAKTLVEELKKKVVEISPKTTVDPVDEWVVQCTNSKEGSGTCKKVSVYEERCGKEGLGCRRVKRAGFQTPRLFDGGGVCP